MREQLIQYVNLLFAGAPDSEDIKQEILQNTLDRYDDLVSQGKQAEAAYRLAISGIGDISEILGTQKSSQLTSVPPFSQEPCKSEKAAKERKTAEAVAVALYITCPLPLIILQNEIGLCFLFVIVAAATALLVIYDKKNPRTNFTVEVTPQQKLKRSLASLISSVGLAVYLILSFATRAWHITWIVFLIMACVQGLVNAILDLKEASKNEN